MEPSTYSPTDPAHPSNPNTNHTTRTGEKPTDAYTAITDPTFLPTLDSAPTTQHIKSHLLLFLLLLSCISVAYFAGFELFQVSDDASWGRLGLVLGAVVGGGAMLMWWTGSYYIDWWELVAGYWWLSMPVAGGMVVLLVMAQEQATGLPEVD